MKLDDLLDEMDPASDTSTSSSDDEQGDHRSQIAVSDDEIILDQHVSNDVTPIVLYSSSSEELADYLLCCQCCN